MPAENMNLPELRMKRTFDAPRTRVFATFTNAEQLAQWWGPHGFSAPVCRADARPGGELYIEMSGPKGTPWEEPYPMFGQFIEVVEPEKIVFVSMLKNAAGIVFLENVNTVTLTETDGKTMMELHVRVMTAGLGSEDPLAGMAEGWKQTVERLQAFVRAA